MKGKWRGGRAVIDTVKRLTTVDPGSAFELSPSTPPYFRTFIQAVKPSKGPSLDSLGAGSDEKSKAAGVNGVAGFCRGAVCLLRSRGQTQMYRAVALRQIQALSAMIDGFLGKPSVVSGGICLDGPHAGYTFARPDRCVYL